MTSQPMQTDVVRKMLRQQRALQAALRPKVPTATRLDAEAKS